MTFLLQTLIATAQLVLAFYGFWLVWRVLLPVLPGPRDQAERIARFAGYFLDPFTQFLVRALHVSALLLLVVAAAHVALGRLSNSL